MSFWDLIFDLFEKYFEWQQQIELPGFEGVSLFEFKVALFITGIIISGLISIVPNAAYTLGEGASERRQRRKVRKAEEREQAKRDAEIDALVHQAVYGDDDS